MQPISCIYFYCSAQLEGSQAAFDETEKRFGGHAFNEIFNEAFHLARVCFADDLRIVRLRSGYFQPGYDGTGGSAQSASLSIALPCLLAGAGQGSRGGPIRGVDPVRYRQRSADPDKIERCD